MLEVENILIIHVSGRVGDTLLVTPVLETVRSYFKRANINFFVHRNTVDLVRNSPFVNHISLFSKKSAKYKGWLSRKKYDLAIVVSGFYEDDSETLIPYACRVSHNIVAFKSPNSKLLNSCVHFQVDKNFNNKKHVIDYYHDLTNKLGMPIIGRRINFHSSKSELRKAHELLQSSPLKACELIIGVKITGLASRSYRDWPTKNFLQLTNLLSKQYSKIGFILLGGLNEYDKNEDIATSISAPVLNMSGEKLREIGAIMKYLDLYIGVDTGFTQLARSYDHPMVVLYPPSIPKHQSQPMNHPNFYSLECPKKLILDMNKEDMMATIDPEKVFEKINLALTGVMK